MMPKLCKHDGKMMQTICKDDAKIIKYDAKRMLQFTNIINSAILWYLHIVPRISKKGDFQDMLYLQYTLTYAQ